MNGLFAAWFAETAIITWRSFTRQHRPPLPSEFAAAFVIFGALGLMPDTAKAPATAIGWGLVLATLLRLGPADFNQAATTFGSSSAAGNPGGVTGTPAPSSPAPSNTNPNRHSFIS